jgi:NFACT protein RNA binding domain
MDMLLAYDMEKVAYTWILQFHADNLSSAHVYLRMKTGDLWTSIPQALLEDCAQLTKANSIEGICPSLGYLPTSSGPPDET